MSNASLFLVADIGGTNTRVGLADDTGLISESTRRYRNSENDSFAAVLEQYLDAMKPGALAGACAGAAGLVVDGVAFMTNLDWAIDHDVMTKVSGAPVANVINDLQAQGYALNDLTAESLSPVVSAITEKPGPRLVIGLGTGFNIVPVHQYGTMLIVPSCEAGHAALPYSVDLLALQNWLHTRKGRATVERALAGQGLQNIYEFHAGARLDAGVIMQAYAEGDRLAQAAVADYVTLLGEVTGDLALQHLPFGGIYFTGGVARAIAPELEKHGFAKAMQNKDGFAELVEKFTVTLIQDDFAALKGCARYLAQKT